MSNLKGIKVLVTGGSSGIGKATAALLISKGAIVAITGRDKKKLDIIAQEIKAIPIHMDVSKYKSIDAKVLDAFHSMGGIDVLINNAGIGSFAQLKDVKLSQFEEVFATNVFGLALLTKEVIKFFKVQQKGTIINVGSTAAKKGFEGGTIYAASKFALRGMTQCWSQELRRENIRVMLINPSEVPTAFHQKDRRERPLENKKLTPNEIAHSISAMINMEKRGMVPELDVWATNPF